MRKNKIAKLADIDKLINKDISICYSSKILWLG